tara:strand:+ start:25950 stop:26672 length:723 start_codon:yes stop_codon:yes gene_type:complete
LILPLRLHIRSTLLIIAATAALLGLGFSTLHLLKDRGTQTAVNTGAADRFAPPGTVPIGGPFTLVNHEGRTVTDEDFAGKYLLVFFGFTNCPDVCPTTLNDIAVALDMLGADAKTVWPLFISIDPERDTPDLMAEYVAAFDPRIIGLTGSAEQIATVAEAYRIFYEKTSVDAYFESDPTQRDTSEPKGDEYFVSHQGQTYLMSPDNDYLTHFNFGASADEMASTIRLALSTLGRPDGEEK